MIVIILLVLSFLSLALGMFGLTGKAIVAWFLAVNGFYIVWMIIHYWRNRK